MNDGGPAYPVKNRELVVDDDGSHTADVQHLGMSLRDRFAIAALQGVLASGPMFSDELDMDKVYGLVAKSAYDQADAMLKARGGDGDE